MINEPKFYIKIYSDGNFIVEKFVDSKSKKHFIDRIPYEPYIFLDYQLDEALKILDFKEFKTGKTIYGNKLDSLKSYYVLRKKLKESNTKIYFDIPLNEQYRIFNYYNKDLSISDKSIFKILSYDIETKMGTSKDFAEAQEPLQMITFQNLITKEMVTYGLKDSSDNPFYIKLDSEEDLIIKYFETIKDADIITGWNNKLFDDKFMINRTIKIFGEDFIQKHFGLNYRKVIDKNSKSYYYKYKEINSLDYIDMYQVLTRSNLPSYSLNSISELELKETKLEYSDEYSDLDDLYKRNYNKYVFYNQKDVELIGRIEDKLNLFSLVINLSYLYRSDFEDSITTIKNWENYLYCKLIKEKQIPYYTEPVKYSSTDDITSYQGAYINSLKNEFKTGWCIVFDIASSYPNQIISYNLSPETIIDFENLPTELKDISKTYNTEDKIIENLSDFEINITPVLKRYNVILNPAGHFFKKESLGLLPSVTKKLFEERYKFKWKSFELESKLKDDPNNKDLQLEFNNFNNKNRSYKTALVSLYGASANKYFKFFDRRLAESTTAGGRLSIKGISKHLESLGFKVLANHTDSMYISVDEFVTKKNTDDIVKEIEEKSKEIQKIIEDYFNYVASIMNHTESRIKMEMEKIISKVIFVAKTHRIVKEIWKNGKMLPEPELDFTGINVIRSSTSDFTKKYFKEFLNLLFDETITDQEINDFLVKAKDVFWKSNLEFIASKSGITDIQKKNLGDKSIPIHVLGSLVYNEIVKKKKLKLKQISSGSKIKYIYTFKNNFLGTHCIATLDKFSNKILDGINIDLELQWNKTFFQDVEKLCNINETKISLGKPLGLF